MAVDYQVKLDAGTILLGLAAVGIAAGLVVKNTPWLDEIEQKAASWINPGIKDTPDDPWPGFGVNKPPGWVAGLGGGAYWLWDLVNG